MTSPKFITKVLLQTRLPMTTRKNVLSFYTTVKPKLVLMSSVDSKLKMNYITTVKPTKNISILKNLITTSFYTVSTDNKFVKNTSKSEKSSVINNTGSNVKLPQNKVEPLQKFNVLENKTLFEVAATIINDKISSTNFTKAVIDNHDNTTKTSTNKVSNILLLT
jgi:hypothetical protein